MHAIGLLVLGVKCSSDVKADVANAAKPVEDCSDIAAFRTMSAHMTSADCLTWHALWYKPTIALLALQCK